MRCSCGAYIRPSQKRCRNCAVEFARGLDTDRLLIQAAREEEREAVQPERIDQSGARKLRDAIAEYESREQRHRLLKVIFWIGAFVVFSSLLIGVLVYLIG